jgi:hypothetical protein
MPLVCHGGEIQRGNTMDDGAPPQVSPDDDDRDDVTTILLLVLERATTLSVQVETLRELLEAHGVFSADEFAQRTSELRARWQLPEHPHTSLSEPLTPAAYFAQIRRILDPAPKAGSPPEDES